MENNVIRVKFGEIGSEGSVAKVWCPTSEVKLLALKGGASR